MSIFRYANLKSVPLIASELFNRDLSIVRPTLFLNFVIVPLAIDGVLVNENITMTSEASDHSRIAALSRWLRVLSVIKEKYQNLPDSLVLHIWSDVCAGQFRSSFVFSPLS